MTYQTLPDEWLTQVRLVGYAGLRGLPDGVWACPACDGTGEQRWVDPENLVGACALCRGNGRFKGANGVILTERWREPGQFTEPGPFTEKWALE